MHDGHSYNQKQTTINCINWRCTKYYKLKCPAILKTKNETVIETKSTQNHECDPGECKAKEVVNQIKRRAQNSRPTMAIAKEISEILDDYAVQLAMPKKTTRCEQSLENDKKRCVFKYLSNWSTYWCPWWVWSLPPTRQWQRWWRANANIWRRNNEKINEFDEHLVGWWNF